MAGQLHYIRDDWYPQNSTEAADMTAGGKSSFGGGMTSVFSDDKSKIINSQFTKTNEDGSKSTWYSSGTAPTFKENNCNELFKSGGLTVTGFHYKASNMLFEVGTGTTSGETAASISGTNSTTAIRDVMGFSMCWTQYNDKNAPVVIPEKVGLIYASNDRPFNDGRVAKWIIPAETKLAGLTIGDKNDKSNGEYWASYSVGNYQSDNWQKIKNKKLQWIGVIIQTYNAYPFMGMPLQVKIKIKNFRPLVCSGADWGHSSILNRSALFNHWRGSGIIDCYDKKIAIANK